jgi:hypothetical protein
MAFIKHFCRLLTNNVLEDEDVIEFYNIVQSIVPTKLVTAYTDSSREVVSVDVIAYTNPDSTTQNVYEILLEEEISSDEGDSISKELANEFDFDFDFEASVEA